MHNSRIPPLTSQIPQMSRRTVANWIRGIVAVLKLRIICKRFRNATQIVPFRWFHEELIKESERSESPRPRGFSHVLWAKIEKSHEKWTECLCISGLWYCVIQRKRCTPGWCSATLKLRLLGILGVRMCVAGQSVYVDFLESWCQHLRDWSRSQMPSCWSKAAYADSTLYQFECDSCKTFPMCFAPVFAWAVVQIVQNPQCRSICKGFSKHYQSVSNNLVQSISECLSRRLLYVFCMFCSVGFLISPLDFYKSIRIGPPLGFETFEWFENESQLDPRDVTKVTFNVENWTPPPTVTHVRKGRNAKTYACCWGYLSERCPFSRPSALDRGAYNNQR